MIVTLSFSLPDTLPGLRRASEVIELVEGAAGIYADIDLGDGVLTVIWKDDQVAEDIKAGHSCVHGVAEADWCDICDTDPEGEAGPVADVAVDATETTLEEEAARFTELLETPAPVPAMEPEPAPEPGTAGDEHVCPECGRTSTTKQGLGRHRSTAHGVTGASKTAQRRAANATPKAEAPKAPKPKGPPPPKLVQHGSLFKCPHCWRMLGSVELVEEHVGEKHRDQL